jgi:hypothetical protein
VGVVVPRQNGKGSILEARELAGLFLLGERLIIHSAHQFDTSLEAFRRLLSLIEDTPDLDRRVKRVSRSHGEEGIELKGGQRIRFRTRTKGGGRGFSSDCLILDEAMFMPETSHGALLPTLSARPNPQVWYTGSAVDQYVHEDGVVLSRVRRRGVAGAGDALAYFEWSLDVDTPAEVDDRASADPAVWGEANPGLGIRIAEEHVAMERDSMAHRTFVVERLNVGDWPNVDGTAGTAIELSRWDALTDRDSELVDPVSFSFDVAPDRSWASVAAAGRRPDGLLHVEVVDRRRGTGWLADRLAELVERHDSVGVTCDATGPAASLLSDLARAGVIVATVTSSEHAQACGQFYDAVVQGALRHRGDDSLRRAVKGASKRPLGDSWAWSRKNSAVDISPLVASTLALWRSSVAEPEAFALTW